VEYLTEHVSNLVSHLLSLSIGGESSWTDLALLSLEIAPDADAAHAMAGLARAVEADSDLVSSTGIWSLLDRRSRSIASDDPSVRLQELREITHVVLASRRSPQSVGSWVLTLMKMGARPRVETMLQYLAEADMPRSRIGSEILAEAGKPDAFAWMFGDSALTALISDYSEAYPEVMWALVNSLGESGRFWVEELARPLFERLAPRS
jgi:hypothetical protein